MYEHNGLVTCNAFGKLLIIFTGVHFLYCVQLLIRLQKAFSSSCNIFYANNLKLRSVNQNYIGKSRNYVNFVDFFHVHCVFTKKCVTNVYFISYNLVTQIKSSLITMQNIKVIISHCGTHT